VKHPVDGARFTMPTPPGTAAGAYLGILVSLLNHLFVKKLSYLLKGYKTGFGN